MERGRCQDASAVGIVSANGWRRHPAPAHQPSSVPNWGTIEQQNTPCLQELLHNYLSSPDQCRSLHVGSVLRHCTSPRHLVRRLQCSTAARSRMHRLHTPGTQSIEARSGTNQYCCATILQRSTAVVSGQQRTTHPNRLNAWLTSPSASGISCTHRIRHTQIKYICVWTMREGAWGRTRWPRQAKLLAACCNIVAPLVRNQARIQVIASLQQENSAMASLTLWLSTQVPAQSGPDQAIASG